MTTHSLESVREEAKEQPPQWQALDQLENEVVDKNVSLWHLYCNYKPSAQVQEYLDAFAFWIVVVATVGVSIVTAIGICVAFPCIMPHSDLKPLAYLMLNYHEVDNSWSLTLLEANSTQPGSQFIIRPVESWVTGPFNYKWLYESPSLFYLRQAQVKWDIELVTWSRTEHRREFLDYLGSNAFYDTHKAFRELKITDIGQIEGVLQWLLTPEMLLNPPTHTPLTESKGYEFIRKLSIETRIVESAIYFSNVNSFLHRVRVKLVEYCKEDKVCMALR